VADAGGRPRTAADGRGLLVDYGGVLTTNVFDAFNEFCAAEGLAHNTIRDLFRHDERARDLLAALETGELPTADFEARFAQLLGVAPERLIERLFAAMEPDAQMVAAVAAARAHGVRTGLVSNSWGAAEIYERERFAVLFDAVVISGEVGLRKPDPAIYRLAAQRLGVAPERLVLVDDLPGNLKPARALGMTTIAHRDADATLAELERALGLTLR
jgi:epoxide hydrolase-like predicted phosphatase